MSSATNTRAKPTHQPIAGIHWRNLGAPATVSGAAESEA
jgi:hypothetical protein